MTCRGREKLREVPCPKSSQRKRQLTIVAAEVAVRAHRLFHGGLFDDRPLLATTEALRMIEAPSGISGSAFYTVDSTP